MKYTENTKATQSGMTLIELSVVLLVMVGLAGVAVPYVAGMADKAHDSTTGSSIAQLNQTIASFRGNHNALPEKLETLVDASSHGDMIKLISDTNYASGGVGLFVSHDLNAEEALSLRKAGMENVLTNVAVADLANNNRTFGSTGWGNTSTAVVAGLSVAQVSKTTIWNEGAGLEVPAHLAYALGGNAASYDTTCYNYIGMGIGDGNEMVGTAMQSAPVLFVPNGDFNPEKAYARYIAIFKIQKSTTGEGCADQVQPATFLGAVADMDFGALVGSAASQQWATSSKRQAN